MDNGLTFCEIDHPLTVLVELTMECGSPEDAVPVLCGEDPELHHGGPVFSLFRLWVSGDVF